MISGISFLVMTLFNIFFKDIEKNNITKKRIFIQIVINSRFYNMRILLCIVPNNCSFYFIRIYVGIPIVLCLSHVGSNIVRLYNIALLHIIIAVYGSIIRVFLILTFNRLKFQ